MKLKKIKTEAEIRDAISAPLAEGRERVEVTSKDGTLQSVRIGLCHFSMGQYSSFEVAREVEYEETSRFRVKATVPGFPVQVDYFEDYGAAVAKRDSYGDTPGVTVECDTKQVRVLIDRDGNVVREVGEDEPAAPVSLDERVPF